MKKVLICIPTYNRAELLKNQIINILKNIDSDILDIVIFDNASTDETQLIMNQIIIDFENIFYIRNKTNVGFNGNLIEILKYSQTKSFNYHYLFILSDDDIIFTNNFIKILTNLNLESNLILLTWLHTDYSGILKTRPNLNNMNNINYFNIINQTALISSYIYPMRFIRKYNLTEFMNFADYNMFAHIKLIVDCINYTKTIDFIKLPVGYERMNFEWRFNLIKTFCEDRYQVLKYVDNHLGFNNAFKATLNSTNSLLNRILTWNSVGIKKYNNLIVPILNWKLRNNMININTINLLIKLILIKSTLVRKIFFLKRKNNELRGINSQELITNCFLLQDNNISLKYDESKFQLLNNYPIKLNYDFSIKFNKLNKFIKQLKERNSYFAIYGFGLIGNLIVNELKNKISVIIDNQTTLDKYESIDIVPIEKIHYYKYDFIIIAVLGREIEIENSLTSEFKISKEKLIFINLS